MKKIKKLVSVVGPFATIGQKVNEIIDANPPLEAGAGLIITRSESNILIGLDSIKNPMPPFTLYAVAGLTLGITPGLVNGISPTFTGATAGTGGTLLLSSVPPPLLTITGTRYFWLKCVGTFGANDTYVVTVESNTTGTVPAAEAITGTGFTSFLALGYVTVTSGSITVIENYVRAYLGVESYGNVNNWWALS